MRRYEMCLLYTCDICNTNKVYPKSKTEWPKLWQRWFPPEIDICGECREIFIRAKTTHKDPLVDLVNRKREEI